MGKRSLEAAIAQSKNDVEVRWLPFRMRPDVGPEGSDQPPRMYLDKSYVAHVQSKGKEAGLDFSHKCRRVPNTHRGHTLVGWAAETSIAKQNEVAEIVFRKYHADGLDPTDPSVLVDAAVEAGLDKEAAQKVVTSKERLDAVAQEIRANARVGGVPHFIINGKGGMSGARAPAEYLRAIDRA